METSCDMYHVSADVAISKLRKFLHELLECNPPHDLTGYALGEKFGKRRTCYLVLEWLDKNYKTEEE